MKREETPEIILKRRRLINKNNLKKGSLIFYEGTQRKIVEIGRNYKLCLKTMIDRSVYVDPLDVL